MALPHEDILPLYAPNTVYTDKPNPNNPHVTYPPIPEVPVRTPMVDENGLVSRTWFRYFQRVFNPGSGGPPTQAGPWQRTLLLKDTTVGNDIADHVTIWNQAGGTCLLVTGVLKQIITKDLTVRIKLAVYPTPPVIVGTFTIPLSTAIDQVIKFPPATFTLHPATFPFLAVLRADITASDGSVAAAGIASFTIEWQ